MTEFRKFVRYSEIMVNEINKRNTTIHFGMYTTYKNTKKETIYITAHDTTNNAKYGIYNTLFNYCGFKASRPVFDKCSKQVQIVDGKEETFDTKDFTIHIFEVMMKKALAGEYGDLVMTYME